MQLRMLGASLAALSLFSSCGRQQPTSAPAAVKVGVILPLTGEAASYGADCRKGIELALDSVSGQDPRIELVFEDSKADPKQAVAAMRKLVDVDRVRAVIGDMFSSTTLAIAPIAANENVLLLTPTAADEAIPKTGPQIFSIYPSASLEGRLLARFAREKQFNTCGVFHQDISVAKSMAAAFAEEFKSKGGKVLFNESYATEPLDYRSLLAKHSRDNPDVVFVTGYKETVIPLLTQAKETGLNSSFLSQSSLFEADILATHGDLLEGVAITAPMFNESASTATAARFRKDYQEKFNAPPSVWAAYGYDALTIVAKAFSTNREKQEPVWDTLRALTQDGPTGFTSFDHNNFAEKEMQIFVVKNRAFVAP